MRLGLQKNAMQDLMKIQETLNQFLTKSMSFSIGFH